MNDAVGSIFEYLIFSIYNYLYIINSYTLQQVISVVKKVLTVLWLCEAVTLLILDFYILFTTVQNPNPLATPRYVQGTRTLAKCAQC